jgi:hypothetical protein
MNQEKSLTLPPAPNLIGAIRSGFDATTNNLLLILFPIMLDLVLWVGPRLRLTELINSISNQLFRVSTLQDPEMVQLIQPMQELWSTFAERFNLLAVLRTYPVGVTSLLVSRLPVNSPLGFPASLEIKSLSGVFFAFVLIAIGGIVLGTLYFTAVAQAAVDGAVNWRQAIDGWPWAALQMIFLALLWFGFLFLITIPGSFLLSLVLLSGISFAQCALFLYVGFVFWLVLPIVFSPHGIVLNQNSFYSSIIASAKMMRRTLPTSVLFILVVFLISKALDYLWLVPSDASWLLVIGILGHAFITTGLLASSFVYYRDALRWMQGMVKIGSISTI